MWPDKNTQVNTDLSFQTANKQIGIAVSTIGSPKLINLENKNKHT